MLTVANMLTARVAICANLLGIVFCQTVSLKKYINGTVDNDLPVALNISTKAEGRNATAPLLYGWMIEDINHSIDGGLYAEMITNRAFQGSTVTIGKLEGFNGTVIVDSENPLEPFGPVLTGYRSIGGARLSLDRLHPLSSALPTVMKVEIPLNASGEVGFLNEGWWGMDVSPQTYNASFYVKADGPFDAANLTTFSISLRSNLTKDIWISSKIIAHDISDIEYTQVQMQLINNVTAPNSNNTFAVTFNGSEVAGKTFYFSLISLFPETYKGRPNGLRKDLGQNIKDLNPKFLRFPGGNNMEGYSIDSRWKFNETIGPLINRPGRPGTWEYYNTDGFGLLEFLEWTEDMELEPVLAIYAGYSLAINGGEGPSYPQHRMNEVLQSALDELDYCMGNSSTKFGALRAAHGHPEPFQINYLDIGNEDFFSGTYSRRFKLLYDGLKAAYPDINIISTAYNENADYKIDIPAGGIYDLHHYSEPTFFLEQFNFFDNWQTETGNENVSIFIGEYSVPSADEPTGKVNFSSSGPHIFYPQLLSALAEAVYLLAMERTPVVQMSSYAPSLQNFNWWNWTPDLFSYDADPCHTVLSISWYLQSLFAHHRGTHTLPVKNTAGNINPLFWVATIDESLDAIYLKVCLHLLELRSKKNW